MRKISMIFAFLCKSYQFRPYERSFFIFEVINFTLFILYYLLKSTYSKIKSLFVIERSLYYGKNESSSDVRPE